MVTRRLLLAAASGALATASITGLAAPASAPAASRPAAKGRAAGLALVSGQPVTAITVSMRYRPRRAGTQTLLSFAPGRTALILDARGRVAVRSGGRTTRLAVRLRPRAWATLRLDARFSARRLAVRVGRRGARARVSVSGSAKVSLPMRPHTCRRGACLAWVKVTHSAQADSRTSTPDAQQAVSCPTCMAPPLNRPLFAPDSIWNTPVPADAAVDPSSPALVAALTAEVQKEWHGNYGPWINTSTGSTPFVIVGPDQPLVPVKLDLWDYNTSLKETFGAGVPLPDWVIPSRGGDNEAVVYQPSTDRMWEFWELRKAPDGWHAKWGGAMDGVSHDPGYYTPQAWSGASYGWGASASSLPLIGGTMLYSEMSDMRFDHALAMAVPGARAGVFAWPAQRTDGWRQDATVLPEGAHLRLDPNLDLSTIRMSPLTRAIAEAAQRYGIYVRDQSHGVGFFAEDPKMTRSAPYQKFFGGRTINDLLMQFPWSHLQVLKMNLSSKARIF